MVYNIRVCHWSCCLEVNLIGYIGSGFGINIKLAYFFLVIINKAI